MQISKFILVMAFAGTSLPATLSAQDAATNARQTKELEAVRLKVSEMLAPAKPNKDSGVVISYGGKTAAPANADASDSEQQLRELEAVRQAVRQQQAGVSLVQPADASAQERELQAVREVVAGMYAPKAPAPAPTAATQTASIAPVATPAAPSPAEPKTKQQKLADLLEAYKLDLITPAQYHEQRAKILSEQ